MRSGVALARWAELAFRLWMVGLSLPGRAADWSPTERTDQPWKVVSLLEDGGLAHLNVFNLDFERNTNSARLGTAWIATSDGLHEYDGYTWRRHGRADGLPSDFVRCVLVTRAGQIWVGTDQGAGLYDGKTFRTLGSETNLAGPNVRRITEDPDGLIWFCSDSWPNAGAGGGLTSLRDGQWKAYREADGLPSGYVVNYFRDRSGRQFAATLKGLAEFTAGRWGLAFSPATEGRINWGSGCLAETPGTGLLFSTGRQVFRLQDGAWRQMPAGITHEHGIAATADGGVVAVGRPNQGRSVFLEWAGDRWVPASAEFSTPRGYTEDIQVAPDGSVWVAGYDCLVRWARQGSQWREFTDLPPPKLVDAQGGMWFAQTRGIFTPSGPTVRFHQGSWEPLGTAYDELVNHPQDGSVWGGTTNRLTRWRGTNRTDFTPTQTGLVAYVSGEGDERGNFWMFGVDPQGNPAVARHNGNQWQTRPVPELAGLRPWRETASSSNGVWVAGDRGAGTDAVLVRVTPTGNLRLEAPVQQVGTLGMKFREDRYGAVWLYGDAGLFRWVLGKSTRWDSLGDLPSSSVVSCVERGDELWFGYNGATGGRSALIALRNGQWTNFPVATLGNLSLANDGTLFADGVGQIFRIANRPSAVPVVQQLRTAETAQSVVQDLEGNLWVGAGDAVFRFRSNPRPLRLVLTGAGRVHADDALPVTATALDRFRPPGTGSGAVYSSRVDDGEWSPFTREDQFKLDASRLKVGPHRLEVICQDVTGNRRSEPAVHRFEVAPVPLQERAWFVPGLLGLVAVMASLALVAVNTRRRLAGYAQTLESRVAERTAELAQDIRRRETVEASLRASEERFVQAFQASPVLATISSLIDGRIMDVNRQFCAVFGFSREEMIGRTASELGLWHRLEQRDELLARILDAGSVQNFEIQARTRTGRVLAVLTSAERVELAGGSAVLLSGVDITARRELEDRLLRMGDNLPESYVYQYAREPDGTSRFLHLSGGVERIHGVTVEAVGRDPGELFGLVDPGQIPAWRAAETASAQELTDFSFELRIRRRNGGWGWFQLNSHPHREEGDRVVWDGVVTDVTVRREAEEARLVSEERLRIVTENVQVGLATVDRERRYEYANPAYAAIVGQPLAAIMGAPVPVILADIYEQGVRLQLDRAFAGEQVSFEQARPTATGERFLAATYEPIMADREVVRVVAVITDITERRKAETALQASEERLRMVTGNARVGLVMLDRERRYTYANAAYTEMLGLASADLAGQRVADVLAPVYERQIRPHLDVAFTGERVAYELQRPAPDGDHHYAVRYEPMRTGNSVTSVVVVITEITERKRAELARQASDARYRALFEYAPEGILIGDAQSNYLDANASMCRMLGYTHDELVGLNATDIIVATETPLIGPTIDAIHRRSDHHQDWTFRRKDGSLFPVEVRATQTPDGNLLGLVRDLTERKRAEAALRAKDELLRLVIDLVPHFIFAKDRDSRFLFANRAVAESLGLTPEQLVGRNARDLRHVPAEAEAFLRDDQEVIATGKPKFVPAETLTDAQGRVRIHQTTKIPFRVPGTGEPALIGVAIDITDQKRAETALRESEARLCEAQRIAQVGSWEWDLATGRLFWSDEIFHLFELAVDRTQPFYQAYRNRIHPDDVAAVNRAYADAEQRRAPYEITHRLLFPDGRIKWVQEHGEFEYSATGAPIRSRGTMQDVTERHRAAVTGVLLTAIVESSSDAIVGKDLAGVVTSWNAGAERMFGWPAGEMVGQPIHRLIPPDRQAEETTIMERIRAGVRVEHFETERQRKDGSRVAVSVTVSPIRDATGRIVGASKVARDITERQRMERLLAWEMRALERLVSSASLGELLADLALGVEQHAPDAICSILLLDDDGVHLRHGAAPSLPDAYNRAIDGIAIGPGVGSCGTAAATGRQVVVADIAVDPLWADFRDLALTHGLRACWSTPIAGSAGNILGTFAIYYREPRTPKPAELDLISRAQHLVGLAIERKRVEESLQMTRLSVDRASDSIFWLGRDGHIHYANDAAGVSRGYSRAELLGMSIFDLDPDYQPGVWEPHFEELKRQGAQTLESRHRAKDGRLFPIEINANYVFIRGQEFNFCFVRDITARRRVERRRAAEHAVSRILAESVSLAAATPKILEALGVSEGWEFGELWKVDDTDGRLVCQETWAASGLRSEALEAQTRRLRFGSGEGLPGWVYQSGELVVIPEVEHEARFVRAKEAVAAGLASAIAFPLRTGGPIAGVMTFFGARRMEVDPELVEMLGTLGHQIGQFMARKLAQEELQRFVALSPSVIYALRFTPGGLRAYWVSENLFNLTGFQTSESIHGNWWADHLHPEDRDRVLGENLGVGEADHQVLEFRFRRKDGSYLSLRDEKRLRRDAAGKPIEIIGAWTDITDRVSLEKQLRQAQKMEAIGLLSGGIAHDFNNLLGTIIGNAQLAGLDLTPDHPAAESLEQILTASQRATHLVQQILTFARQEPADRRRVNLLPVVEESVRLLRATLPAGVHLTLIKGEGLPPVLADETQIQQVIINLGTNSWHAFEGRSGRISVEISAVEVDRALAASSSDLQPGPYLRLRVEDTGKGMDAATLERIFEPFFTTKEVGKGTGLGLSVVHGIIKSHGGAILVQSAVGVGTTFDLFLPAAASEDKAGHTGVEAQLQAGRGEQLLLIDDQHEMLRMNRRALERLGYRVVACKDGAEALACFRAEPDAFALVLTDFNMPGMTGLDLARILFSLRPDLPVLLSSGLITEELRQTATAAGVRELLRKPVALQELSQAVARNLPPRP